MTGQDSLTAKIERGFDQLDVHGNGVLTEEDHLVMGRRVASSLGHAEDSPETRRIVDAYLGVWRDVHLPFLPAGSQGISRDRFVASTRSLAENPGLPRPPWAGSPRSTCRSRTSTGTAGSAPPSCSPSSAGTSRGSPRRTRPRRSVTSTPTAGCRPPNSPKSSQVLDRKQLKGRTQVTFVLPADRPDGPVSVVGDFDHWNPAAHPLQARGDGIRAATVVLAAHSGHSFRYPAAGDYWFDDDQADGHDGTNSRVNT